MVIEKAKRIKGMTKKEARKREIGLMDFVLEFREWFGNKANAIECASRLGMLYPRKRVAIFKSGYYWEVWAERKD